MKASKLLLATAAVTVYIVCPAYRYYVIGTWVGYKIMSDKPRKPRSIPKGSKLYTRVLKGV